MSFSLDEEDKEGGDIGSDDDEEQDEDTTINKYKSLIADIKDSEKKKGDKDVDMEITWEPGTIQFNLVLYTCFVHVNCVALESFITDC